MVQPPGGTETDTDTSPITLETLGIGWITEVEEIVKTGPETWFRQQLVEFLLAFIFGVVARISGAIEAAWMFVVDEIIGGASEALGGFAFVGNSAGDFGLWILSQIESAVSLAGPLAPLVWIVLVAITVIAVYRVTKALLTLVNLDSLLQLVKS